MRPCRRMRASMSSGGTRTLSPRKKPREHLVGPTSCPPASGRESLASPPPGRTIATQPSCSRKKSTAQPQGGSQDLIGVAAVSKLGAEPPQVG